MKFWDKISPEPNSGCWLWTGSCDKHGYGKISVSKNGSKAAHRAVYEYFVGQIPKQKLLCHKCDVRCCVNPDHLFVGTNEENQKDKSLKNRTGNRKLTKHEVTIIRHIKTQTRKELARLFNVSKSTIRDVINRKVYKHF